MGASKISSYKTKDKAISDYAKALSHPARIAILSLLLKKKTCICGDIVDELPLSQSTVSQHLKALKLSGLIKGNIDGVSVCYCIDEKEWKKAKSFFLDFFDKDVINKEKCCS